MKPVDYLCSLPPSSLIALEAVSKGTWSSIELLAPVAQVSTLRVRTSEVRIRGSADVQIGAVPVDILPKLEVFRLDVRIARADGETDPRFRPPVFQDSGELLSGFVGGSHQLLVGTRRYAAPEWATGIVREIMVEDLLILRHLSGQQAFIAADDEQPGSLLIARNRDHIPNSEADILSLRPVI